MVSLRYRFYKNLVLTSVVLALCVVSLGAYVRLTDAGLGCPDWPGCYGTMTVPESETAIAHAQNNFPDKRVEVGKAWREMAHRYLAGTLGLFVLILTLISWAIKTEIKNPIWLNLLLLITILFQAMLGMWTVTMLLRPAIVTAHLLGGMTTLALLVWIAHRHWGYSSNSIIHKSSLKILIRLSLIIVGLQIFLGGWTSTNYAALACTDFPTCHGEYLPKMNFKDAFTFIRELGESATGQPVSLETLTAIQWTHRVGALVTFVYLLFLSVNLIKYWQVKRLGVILIFLLISQVLIGIGNLILHLPLVLAVAHNFTAALLLILLVVLNSKISQRLR